MNILSPLKPLLKWTYRGAWQAQLAEQATLISGLLSLSPMMGVEIA